MKKWIIKITKFVGGMMLAVSLFAGKAPQMLNIVNYAQAATIVQQGNYGENLKWSVDSDGVLTISGKGEMMPIKDDSPIPWSLKFDKIVVEPGVTTIGANFMTYRQVKSVELPDTIVKIGNHAFAYTPIKSINLPDSIQTVEDYAFYGCQGWWMIAQNGVVKFPKNIKQIGAYAFAEVADTVTEPLTLHLPEGVTHVGKGAFQRLQGLTLIVPDSVIEIGDYNYMIKEFQYYQNKLVPAAAEKAHVPCKQLANNQEQKITVAGKTKGLTTVSGTVSLKASAPGDKLTYKSSNTKVAKVTKDGNITILKKGTATITITAASTSKYKEAVKKIDLTVKDAAKGTIFTNGNIKYKVLTVGKTVSVTGTAKKNIEALTIPKTVKQGGAKYKVTEIAAGALQNCTKLKSVTIGENVTYIAKKAFANDKELKKIVIKAKKLKTIGAKAFSGINAKVTITIPKSLKKDFQSTLAKGTELPETAKVK